MNNQITQKTKEFYAQLIQDKNHRYLSWEHCYGYFLGENIEPDKACLHMAFYLASWGMYRGSSFLLWKDYQIHKEVVSFLIKNSHLQGIDFSESTEETYKEIGEVISWIRIWYEKNTGKVRFC